MKTLPWRNYTWCQHYKIHKDKGFLASVANFIDNSTANDDINTAVLSVLQLHPEFVFGI